MSEEENKGTPVPGEEHVEDTPQEQEVNHQEQTARQSGWMPKEEWVESGRDPKQWVSAEVYNARGELFEVIHKQKREMSDIRQAMDDLKKLNAQVASAERKKILNDLKRAKSSALEEGDYDKVVEIDDQISELRDVKETKKEDTGPSPEDRQAFQSALNSWMSQNPWYNKDEDMTAYADGVATRMVSQGHSWQEVFPVLADKVRKAFPARFENPKKKDEAAVTTSNKSGKPTKKPKFTFNDLNEDQQKVAMRFKRTNAMSVDDYIQQLVDIGELG